jgi:hypothetical protein
MVAHRLSLEISRGAFRSVRLALSSAALLAVVMARAGNVLILKVTWSLVSALVQFTWFPYTHHSIVGGGCLVPSPFGGAGLTGRDCSQIDDAASVSCHHGKCKVSECIDGYVPSPSANACVPVTLIEPVDSQPLLLAQL